MILYPAIDIRGGCVVRLRQGDYADETIYGSDPVAAALAFADAGATWVHMVDLDAARSGDPVNRSIIGEVAQALRGRAKLQVGGGVRTLTDVNQLATAGVSRVVMGSAAVSNPELVVQASTVLPIAVGLDHRDGEIAIHGWTKASGLSLVAALDMFRTATVFVITDISRDGMLQGPDIDGLRLAANATTIPIIASGGVGTLEHLVQLVNVPKLQGVITGKAIYENCFSVQEAIQVLGASQQ
ncbi:MAG: 1-(5-phosphoribosyl)-5-((5-phosphoribosylamino)methylideneamino)imidazole-4-carboxamide isomerase [Ilumatobacteraceae bacterium]|nr:1-(5-phosphoribosyl)-5-((5-phosphoribosylamino)methylideneamino)imidazole-4-carboxamide isomerase [Ilumatobacteraceae bacterium]